MQTVGALVYTEVTAVMYGLQMRSLTDSYLQTFQNSLTDVDNMLSVFLQRVLFLITAERHEKAVINVVVGYYYYMHSVAVQAYLLGQEFQKSISLSSS